LLVRPVARSSRSEIVIVTEVHAITMRWEDLHLLSKIGL
jgi:hypothetical protein